jgi:uncharacterized protein YaaR (DUF327 family)
MPSTNSAQESPPETKPPAESQASVDEKDQSTKPPETPEVSLAKRIDEKIDDLVEKRLAQKEEMIKEAEKALENKLQEIKKFAGEIEAQGQSMQTQGQTEEDESKAAIKRMLKGSGFEDMEF